MGIRSPGTGVRGNCELSNMWPIGIQLRIQLVPCTKMVTWSWDKRKESHEFGTKLQSSGRAACSPKHETLPAAPSSHLEHSRLGISPISQRKRTVYKTNYLSRKAVRCWDNFHEIKIQQIPTPRHRIWHELTLPLWCAAHRQPSNIQECCHVDVAILFLVRDPLSFFRLCQLHKHEAP